MEKINMSKPDAHSYILNTYFPDKQNIKVIEFGRLRANTPQHRLGDGWSTNQYACCDRVEVLYSIDNNTDTIDVCKEVIPEKFISKVKFLDSISTDGVDTFDLVFVDGPNEPEPNFDFLQSIWDKINENSLVLVDDYGSGGMKYDLIKAFLMKRGYESVEISDMILFVPSNKKRAVIIPAYNRGPYLAQTLDCLKEVRATECFDCFVLVDGISEGKHDPETVGLAGKFDSSQFNSYQVVLREENIGLTKNILWGLRDTIGNGYTQTVVIEDDLLISKDGLEYMIYANDFLGLEENRLFSITGCSGKDEFPRSRIDKAFKDKWNKSIFVSYPEYIWKHIEPHLKEEYYGVDNTRQQEAEMKAYLYKTFHEKVINTELGEYYEERLWFNGTARYPLQAGLLNILRASLEMFQLSPYCSRVKHIGAVGWNQKFKQFEAVPNNIKKDLIYNSDQFVHVHGDGGFQEDYEWESLRIV